VSATDSAPPLKLLLELSVGEHCAETRPLAAQKKLLVEKKIADLRAIQAALEKLVRACGSGRKGRGCPIIESLSTNPLRP
jgi:MerR family transcriptional regulator, mercuric resistance operon regulatory protein